MKKITTKSLLLSAKRRECLAGGLAILSLATLNACGWRVRGKIDLPYKTMFLSGTMTPEFRNELEMYLRINDMVLVSRVQDAEVVLEIVTEQHAKQVLAYNGLGQITAYRIISRIAFRLFYPNGIEIIPESDIYLTRDVEYNPSNIQSFDALVNEFIKTLRTDIVNQLMRRLTSVKKLPTQERSRKTISPKEDQR